jgi:hypothetical protein
MGIIFGNAQGGGGGGGAPVVTGANNGTSLVGGNIQLGGNPLIANTSIDMGGFGLTIFDTVTGSTFNFTPETFMINLQNGGTQTIGVVMEPGEFNISNTSPGTGNLMNLAMSGGSIILTVDDLVAVAGSIILNMIDPNGQGEVVIASNQVSMQWQNAGLSQRIDFQSSGMVITDQVNLKGLVYDQDYHVAGILDPRWIPDYEAVQNVAKVARNAANFGEVASLADVGHVDLPATTDQTMRVGGWIDVLATAGQTVILQVSWITPAAVGRTKTFFIQGAVTAPAATVDFFPFPTMDFRALAGSTVQVSTTVAGVGTILYNVGCTIQKLIGDGGL